MARAKRYWLFKSEPDVFSIDDLAAAPGRTTHWEGVRNYQARNLLRDEIRAGDEVLFYHSGTAPIGVAGIARVVRSGYPEPEQLDPASPFHDPAATAAAPRWYCVDVQFARRFDDVVPLAALKAQPRLANMMVVQRGARLSVQPVTKAEFETVVRMGRGGGEPRPRDPTSPRSPRR